MKKVALRIGSVLALLIAIVVLNTARFTSRQLVIPPAGPVDINLEAASSRLAGALRYATLSPPDTSHNGTSSFDSLRAYIEWTFPGVHTVLRREFVNRYSLLYFWEGSNPDLAPLVLMGHLDVVPVEPGTEADWKSPPFAGTLDGDYVWGRGTLDDKGSVLAILEAIEILVDEGYRPDRSIILAFGHDEEIGGKEGARAIAQYLELEGITPWMVIDEGGIVLEAHSMPVDVPLALIGIAEKGYLSLTLTVRADGGHSSMPGQETAIGMLSRALHRLSKRPFPARLQGVTGQLFDYVGPEMPVVQRTLFANRWLFGPLIVNTLAADPSGDAVLRTTTAPTMLKGSPRDNVLPSLAEAVVNFRIIPGETVESVTERVKRVINDPRVDIAPANDSGMNPSPVSSTESDAFITLQRTIHEIFPDVYVAPYLVVGGTDAKHFSSLSNNVYRFAPLFLREGDLARVHGTNERIHVEDYRRAIRFYRQMIVNATGMNPDINSDSPPPGPGIE